MQSIPDELLDAARIDGASELGIFLRIVVPLSAPALAVLAIFTFLGRWNDYLLPLLVMNRQAMFTLPIGITNFIGEYRAEWSLVMAVVADLDRADGGAVPLLPALLRARHRDDRHEGLRRGDGPRRVRSLRSGRRCPRPGRRRWPSGSG